MTKMNDETKLPKWVQTELLVLRRKVETLNKELLELRGAPNPDWYRLPTGFYVTRDFASKDSGYIRIDPSTRVSAILDYKPEEVRKKIDFTFRREGVLTYLEAQCSSVLKIVPRASNSIYLFGSDM